MRRRIEKDMTIRRCLQAIFPHVCYTGTASFCLQPFTKPLRVACLALPLEHSQSGADQPVIFCLLALTAAGRDQEFVRAALVGGKVW